MLFIDFEQLYLYLIIDNFVSNTMVLGSFYYSLSLLKVGEEGLA